MKGKTSRDHEMVTQGEIDKVWGNAHFGESLTRMDVVRLGVLKCASGYHQGHTSKTIITELGLITQGYRLTARGRACLWKWYGNGNF